VEAFTMQQRPRPERSQTRDMRIQDAFLNHCRRDKVDVTIQLFDQRVMKGQIVGFDSQSIVVLENGTQHLIFKNAVIAINPQASFNYIFNDASRSQPLKSYTEYAADFS
jgi:host factor-I protein